MFRTTALSLTAAVALATSAFADGHSKDIVDTAAGAGDFTTLLAAAEAAGLVDTLKGDGPPNGCRIRGPARRHSGGPAQAGEQRDAGEHPDVSRHRR